MASDTYLLFGLGKMGLSLATNLLSRGCKVHAYDAEKSTMRKAEIASKRKIQVFDTCCSLLNSVSGQREVLLCIPEGKGLDALLNFLSKSLKPKDVIFDMGNSDFRKTSQRAVLLREVGVFFCDIGVSGGPEGALKYPSLMAGTDNQSRFFAECLVDRLQGEEGDFQSAALVGDIGMGHFAKSVHNAIEYCIMQTLGELKQIFVGKGAVFYENSVRASLLDGFLAEITFKQTESLAPLKTDCSQVTVGQNGTGLWIAQFAFDNGIPFPSLNRSIEHRLMSSKATYYRADKKPQKSDFQIILDTKDTVEFLDLIAISIFIQGLSLFNFVYRKQGNGFHIENTLRAWKNGSVLRGAAVNFLCKNLPMMQDNHIFLGDTSLDRFVKMRANSSTTHRTVIQDNQSYAPVTISAVDYFLHHPHFNKISRTLQAQRRIFGGHEN